MSLIQRVPLWGVTKEIGQRPAEIEIAYGYIGAARCSGCCIQAGGRSQTTSEAPCRLGEHASLADMAMLCEPAPCDMCLALFRAPGSPAGPCAAAEPFAMLSCFLPWLSWGATAESCSPAICCRMPFDLPCARMHACTQLADIFITHLYLPCGILGKWQEV